jgi:hypothetical protein
MATAKRVRTKKTTEPKAESSSKPAVSVAAVTTRTVDLQDAIRQRAYEIYKERGGQHGADLEDWVRAEKEVLQHFRGRTA